MFPMMQFYYRADSEKFNGKDEGYIEGFMEAYEFPFTVTRLPLSLSAEVIVHVLAGAAKDFSRTSPQGMPYTTLRRLFLYQ